MMKNLIVVVLLAATLWCQDEPRSRQPRMAKGSAKDRAAVIALLNRMGKAWNAGDATGYCEAFADAVDFTTAAGDVYTTREAFQKHLADLLRSSYKGARTEFEIRRTFFVRPRVMIADLDVTIWKYRSAPPGSNAKGGKPLHMRLKYVLSSEPKGWLIVSGQETEMRASK